MCLHLVGRRGKERDCECESNQRTSKVRPNPVNPRGMWPAVTCELRCPSPVLRNGGGHRQVAASRSILLFRTSRTTMVTFIEQPFMVAGGPEKQGAHGVAAATLTLDIRASTRINTSRTNIATTKTKIIMTCLRVLLVSYVPKGKPLYPGSWHLGQLIQNARSKVMSKLTACTGTSNCSGEENSRGFRDWMEAWRKHGRRVTARARSPSCRGVGGQIGDVANLCDQNSLLPYQNLL
jgi:hypothetical protein